MKRTKWQYRVRVVYCGDKEYTETVWAFNKEDAKRISLMGPGIHASSRIKWIRSTGNWWSKP
jgi:hypothetical protein